MKLKHTPEKLDLVEFDTNPMVKVTKLCKYDNHNEEIARFNTPCRKTNKQNALLYSCAPEMLERLIKNLKDFKEHSNLETIKNEWPKDVALIEKATGQKIVDILKTLPDITYQGTAALWILYDARNEGVVFRDVEKLLESISIFAAKYEHTETQFERAKNELIKSSADHFSTI